MAHLEYRFTPEQEIRFWSRVDKNGPAITATLGPCWLWTGPKSKKGYGYFKRSDQRYQVHRASWFLRYGAIPPGLFVCHRCDVTNCVRSDHLFLGTHTENMADMVSKHRWTYRDNRMTTGRALAMLSKRQTVEHPCAHCGAVFMGIKKSKYCSDQCRWTARNKRNAERIKSA
jgi:hypothetical protein